MYTNLILCGTTLLVIFVLQVQSGGHGDQGPIIIKTSGRKGRNNDLVMIGGKTKCGHGPTLIKTGGYKRRHGSDLILIGGQNKCHEKKKEEVKHIPVPYPVKEYVPVPYKETVHVPVHVPIKVPVYVKKEEHKMGGMEGMDMDMGGYDMGGFDMGSMMGGMDMGGYGYRRRR